jgi:hypothetical protein
MANREALFYFSGGGLYVTGDVLGHTAQFSWAGRRATIALPTKDHISDAPLWGRQASGRSRRGDDRETSEITTASVTTFEVRIEVPTGIDDNDAVEDAFPIAVEIAGTLLGTARTLARQFWISPAHEAPTLHGYGSLVVLGTYGEVSETARWHPPIVLGASDRGGAINVDTMQSILAALARGAAPSLAEVLLADAQAAVAGPTVSQHWKRERRDTARVVLLAAIASEVKIKETLLLKAPAQFTPLLDIILGNPREVAVAAGQLVDKPTKAVTGRSLREDDRPLFKAVSENLFPQRNKVAHAGYQPTIDEAHEAVATATALFAWLDSLPRRGNSDDVDRARRLP